VEASKLNINVLCQQQRKSVNGAEKKLQLPVAFIRDFAQCRAKKNRRRSKISAR